MHQSQFHDHNHLALDTFHKTLGIEVDLLFSVFNRAETVVRALYSRLLFTDDDVNQAPPYSR